MPVALRHVRIYAMLMVPLLALLFLALPANEVSADRQWDIHTSSGCGPNTTKGGVGVDCGSYFYLSSNSSYFSGRTVTRADEDVDWIKARNLGVERCRKSPNFAWDSWYVERKNDDYVSARGSARVTRVLCLPEGWLASHGLSIWPSGSLERSSQSLEHHPTAIHN